MDGLKIDNEFKYSEKKQYLMIKIKRKTHFCCQQGGYRLGTSRSFQGCQLFQAWNDESSVENETK